MKLLVSGLLLFFAAPAFGEASDWTPPAAWQPKKIAGRDFHYFGARLGYDDAKAPPKNAAFDAMSSEYRIFPERTATGAWWYNLERAKLVANSVGEVRPFTLNFYPRCILRPNVFYAGTLDQRQEAYEAYVKAHPEFVGFVTLEWVNDTTCVWNGPRQFVNNRRRQFNLTTNEYEAILHRDDFVHGRDDRDQFTTNLLRRAYDRIVEICHNDPKRLWIGEGSFCADHLCADWGAGALAMESSRNYCFWQIQMMFCRGAARQYDLPWYWYLASFFLGYDSRGKWSGKGNQDAATPHLGLSRSAVRRASYMTWLAGANCYQREGMPEAYYEPGTNTLAREGRIFEEFQRFTSSHTRGIPYQPVALLVPFNRGYTRAGGIAYKRFAYTHPDKMLDAVVSTLLEVPKNSSRAAAMKGAERVMANSKYGDLFDVLVPNASRRQFFRTALANYAVAVLLGDYGDDAVLADDLRAYVERGGKLVLNAAQANARFAWARGGEILRKDDAGSPLYSRKGVGRGSVYFVHEPYWCPWQDNGKERAFGVNFIGEDRVYPEIGRFFNRLLEPLYPLKVSGEVQYGFNRLKDGWQVYLVNNGGVTKFADKAESFDPKGAEVTFDPAGCGADEIRELFTDTRLSAIDGKIRLTVPSGDVRIVNFIRKGK